MQVAIQEILHVRKNIFTVRMVKCLNRFSIDFVESQSLEIFIES